MFCCVAGASLRADMLKILTALTIFTPNTSSHIAYTVMHPIKNVLAMNHLVDNDKILDINGAIQKLAKGYQ